MCVKILIPIFDWKVNDKCDLSILYLRRVLVYIRRILAFRYVSLSCGISL